LTLFKRRKKAKTTKEAGKTISYDEALRAGSSIGRIATNIWNSQKNPGKAYIFNRRVHHGEIGVLLGLSNLFKKSKPDAAGVLSGLGEALSQDDIGDKEEWFKFKKKENIRDSEKSDVETKQYVDESEARSDERNAE
jgi:hypothetical protein